LSVLSDSRESLDSIAEHLLEAETIRSEEFDALVSEANSAASERPAAG